MQELQDLYREFDLHSLIHPTSVEHFLMNLVIIAALLGCAWLLFKFIAQFF